MRVSLDQLKYQISQILQIEVDSLQSKKFKTGAIQ
ncbi:unnamed protein product [Paramecium sonneborni]|uniref:Uncharacterized protein n=1 Tax=Paramecium sonneborni TaxID=65129 RepID=A0A8S1PFS0_9CILI|nr:unnamed protein product [Paramecium sonneborni]